jgi:enamine deaminase RidA (YjgF/YER057c/UK114 family)
MGMIDAKLAKMGIVLPEAMAPVANYVPYVLSDRLLFISGQIPMLAGKPLFVGQLGGGVSLEQGTACARQCGINLIAQMKAACAGDLDKVQRIVKLVCFVNAAPHFVDVPKVANGVSDLMVEVFGDKGRHARSSVGCSSLPLDVPVEVEAIVELA